MGLRHVKPIFIGHEQSFEVSKLCFEVSKLCFEISKLCFGVSKQSLEVPERFSEVLGPRWNAVSHRRRPAGPRHRFGNPLPEKYNHARSCLVQPQSSTAYDHLLRRQEHSNRSWHSTAANRPLPASDEPPTHHQRRISARPSPVTYATRPRSPAVLESARSQVHL